jgi:hypothetical protein
MDNTIHLDFSPLALFGVLALIFFAAVGVVFIGLALILGWLSTRSLERQLAEEQPATVPALAMPALTVAPYDLTRYDLLQEPTPPPPAEWRSWNSDWAGEATAAFPTLLEELEDDTEVDPPTPARARRRFERFESAAEPAARTSKKKARSAPPPTPAAEELEMADEPPTQLVHRFAGGWKGTDPGSCGAECSCGDTYDGFDSLAEASELIDRHIARANGPMVLTIHDPEGRYADMRVPVPVP